MGTSFSAHELGRLGFHGAAGGVTGSRYLLETRHSRVLVECGMFQGDTRSATWNREPFPFAPAEVDAVLLTHAHIDHSGLLPRLAAEGFRGPIHASEGTHALCRVMLLDSARIHEGDARRRSRERDGRRREPVEPLYTVDDAERTLGLFRPHRFFEPVRVREDLEVRYRPAGHILGAATLEVDVRDGDDTRRIVFSGDLGRRADPLLVDPSPPDAADLLLLESTYGDRDHRSMDATLEELCEILQRAATEGGNLIFPVFAVGRAQELIYHIGRLEREGRIHPRPVFLDSPMAIDVTELYRELRECCRKGHPERVAKIRTRELVFARSTEDSKAINERRGVVVLAASGMCDAGRVVHHLRHNLRNPASHIVIVGYQAEGTRGRELVDGARRVEIHGDEIPVRASVHTLGGFSAHAGQSELLDWFRALEESAPTVALVHGEDRQRAALAKILERRTGRRPLCPMRGEVLSLPRPGHAFEPLASDRRGAAP